VPVGVPKWTKFRRPMTKLYRSLTLRLFITAQCTLMQSAVLRSHVVRLSVRLSVCRRVRSHCRRDSTQQLSRVGVGGVYWAPTGSRTNDLPITSPTRSTPVTLTTTLSSHCWKRWVFRFFLNTASDSTETTEDGKSFHNPYTSAGATPNARSPTVRGTFSWCVVAHRRHRRELSSATE